MKETNEKYFLVNKLESNLTVKQGYLKIAPLSYAPINKVDANDPTVLYALGRDWAEITSTEPKSKGAKEKEIALTVTEPYRGMSAEELKDSKASEKVEDPAVSSALGQAELEIGSAKGEALGQDSTVEMKSEAVSKAKKKAA